MPLPTITYDESGHTGDHLMDSNQPCLVLAGIHMDDATAADLLKLLPPTQATEYKAKNLLQFNKGRKALLDILNDSRLNGSNCKVHLTDKPLMATMTLVDTFHYEMARESGYDMHTDGSAPALAHLLHICTSTFVGRETYFKMLRAFNDLSRHPDETTLDAFYTAFLPFYEAVFAADPDFAKNFWFPIIVARHEASRLIPKLTTGIGYDPVATSLFVGLHRWGDRLGQQFDVLCDESASITKLVDHIRALSSPDEPERIVGFGNRKVRFPMRVNSVQFGNSKNSAAIQLADLIAGTVKSALLGHLKYSSNTIPEVMKLLIEKDFLEDGLLPSTEAMTDFNKIEEPFGTNVTEYSAQILRRRQP